MDDTSKGHKAARTLPRKQEPPLTCSGCSHTWTGTSRCHCASCHATFTGISAFDEHRRGGRCQHPESAGLVHGTHGYWGYEPMSAEAIAARSEGHR